MKILRIIALRLFFASFLTASACLTCGAVPAKLGSPGKPFVLTSTTPTFRWEKVPGADLYAFYVSRYPYGTKNLVYKNKSLKKTSFKIPNGCLVDGERYRWNVMARKKSNWKDSSEQFYFQVQLNGPTARDGYRPGK